MKPRNQARVLVAVGYVLIAVGTEEATSCVSRALGADDLSFWASLAVGIPAGILYARWAGRLGARIAELEEHG